MSLRQWIVPAVVAVVAVAATLVVTRAGGTPSEVPPTATPTPEATVSDPPATAQPGPSATPEFTTFRSEEARIEVRYPRDWTTLESPDEQVVLVATPNQRDSLLIRTVGLDQEVTAEDLPRMQQVTDRIVRSGEGIEVLVGPREVTVNGLPGYYYLYRFVDTATGQRGAHAHYFLFDGSRMVVLVFQALPDSGFEELADVFDRIASSLRTLPSE